MIGSFQKAPKYSFVSWVRQLQGNTISTVQFNRRSSKGSSNLRYARFQPKGLKAHSGEELEQKSGQFCNVTGHRVIDGFQKALLGSGHYPESLEVLRAAKEQQVVLGMISNHLSFWFHKEMLSISQRFIYPKQFGRT